MPCTNIENATTIYVIVIISDFSGISGRLSARAIEIPPLRPHQVITILEPLDKLDFLPNIESGVEIAMKRTPKIRGINSIPTIR